MAFAQLDAPRAARSLLTLSAVRERAAKMLGLSLAGQIVGLSADLTALPWLAESILKALPAFVPLPLPLPFPFPAPSTQTAHELFALILPQTIAAYDKSIILGGVKLGDCALHTMMKRGDASDGIVPFHAEALLQSHRAILSLFAEGEEVAASMTLPAPALASLVKFWQAHSILPAHADDVALRALSIALCDRLDAFMRPSLPDHYALLPVAAIMEASGIYKQEPSLFA